MSQSRTLARQAAVQALYQWQLTRDSLKEIERQFVEERDLKPKEQTYFSELLHRIPERLKELDDLIGKFVDRPLEQVDPVERAILRIGAYELLAKVEVPYRVILNESINLAKMFGASQSHRYVNGILDKLAQQLRPAEIRARKPR